jgi:hypothetical protein
MSLMSALVPFGPNLIGRQAEPYEMYVEIGKIREFAKATKSSNVAHLTGEHPVVPPTFLMTMMAWQGEGNSVWHGVDRDLSRQLHGEQEFVFHGEPPRAGTRLRVSERMEDIYEKTGKRGGSMLFSVIVTEFHDESGQLVATATMTQIRTGQVPSE